MTGTIVNVAAIAIGSVIGLLIHSRLPQRFNDIVFQGLGLVTVLIGVSMGLRSDNIILVVVSIVLGAIIGELLRIEQGLEGFANSLKDRFRLGNGRFTQGFVTASMLYCVGSMAVLGSIEDGMGEVPKLLLTKSIMDGVAAIALSASFGVGVLFSVVPVLIYQGVITLFAQWFSVIMSQKMIDDMTCVGGVLLIGLAINILGIKKISVVNMLPALVIIVILSKFFG